MEQHGTGIYGMDMSDPPCRPGRLKKTMPHQRNSASRRSIRHRCNELDLKPFPPAFLLILSGGGKHIPDTESEPHAYQQPEDKAQSAVVCENELSNVHLHLSPATRADR